MSNAMTAEMIKMKEKKCINNNNVAIESQNKN